MNAPYYLKKAGKAEVKVTAADGTVVFETELDAKKGINYATWGLLNKDEKLIEAGTYTLHVSGKGFDEEKEFKVVKFNRW